MPITYKPQETQAPPAQTAPVSKGLAEKVPTPAETSGISGRGLAGLGVRVGSGIVGSTFSAVPGIGTLTGGAIGGGGELLAELIEGSKPNLARIGVEAGLTAVPLGKIYQSGRAGLSALRGAGFAGAGLVGRQLAEGQDLDITSPSSILQMALGAGMGAYAGKGKVSPAAGAIPMSDAPVEIGQHLPNLPDPKSPEGIGFAISKAKELKPISAGEHAALAEQIATNPKGPTAVSIHGPKGAPEPDAIADIAKAEEVANTLRTKITEKDAVQTARNLAAKDKFGEKAAASIDSEIADKAKLAEKGWQQEGKNMNLAQKELENQAALKKIEQDKGGLVRQIPSVAERTSATTPSGASTTSTTRFSGPISDPGNLIREGNLTEPMNQFRVGSPSIDPAPATLSNGPLKVGGPTVPMLVPEEVEEQVGRGFNPKAEIQKVVDEQRQGRAAQSTIEDMISGLDNTGAKSPAMSEQEAEHLKAIEQSFQHAEYPPELPAESGIIPMSDLRKTPLEIAGEHYGNMKTLAKQGLAPEEARATAGKAAARMNSEKIVSELPDEAKKVLEGMDPTDQNRIINWLKKNPGQRGAIDPTLLARIGLGAGGAAVGGAMDEDDPLRGALIGGAAGAALPSVVGKGGEVLSKAAQIYPDYQRASLLFNWPNLMINSLVAPYGSSLLGAAEHALGESSIVNKMAGTTQSGNKWASEYLKHANPGTFLKEWMKAGPEAENAIHDASARGEVSSALDKAPKWIRSILSRPGKAMSQGDMAAQNMMQSHGAPREATRAITLTDEGELPFNRGIAAAKRGAKTEGGKRSFGWDTALPFYRTVANQIEGSMERTPGLGKLVQGWKDKPDPKNMQIAQQVLGGGVAGASFLLGTTMPVMKPENPMDLASSALIGKIISNAGGQYGTLALAAFAAGQAMQNGDNGPLQGVIEATKTFANSTPLPTTEPAQDLMNFVDKASQGELSPNDIPRSIWPQALRPDMIESLTSLFTPSDE